MQPLLSPTPFILGKRLREDDDAVDGGAKDEVVAAAAAAAGGFWAVPMRPCVPSEPSDLIGVSDQSLEERFCWFPLQFRLFTLINVLDLIFPKARG